jgi:hypothetical protein
MIRSAPWRRPLAHAVPGVPQAAGAARLVSACRAWIQVTALFRPCGHGEATVKPAPPHRRYPLQPRAPGVTLADPRRPPYPAAYPGPAAARNLGERYAS